MRFKSLVARKHWSTEQAASQLMILIELELGQDVQTLARQAVEANASFEDFYDQIVMLMVPGDFSEDLDEELWSLTKRRDETVQAISRRLKELVRLFAELPTNAEIIPEVQQCLFSKCAMPNDWQDKLAVAGDH